MTEQQEKPFPTQTLEQKRATEKAEKSLVATRKRIDEHLRALAGK